MRAVCPRIQRLTVSVGLPGRFGVEKVFDYAQLHVTVDDDAVVGHGFVVLGQLVDLVVDLPD